MYKLSKWTLTECSTGAFRYRAGTDGNDIDNRYAFIEKTPRIRIRESYLGTEKHWDDNGVVYSVDRRWPEFLDWCSGTKGDGPCDPNSRKWCDTMLVALGYELED